MIIRQGEKKARPGLYVEVEETGLLVARATNSNNQPKNGALVLNSDSVLCWTGNVEPKINENEIVEYTPTPTVTGAGVLLIDG